MDKSILLREIENCKEQIEISKQADRKDIEFYWVGKQQGLQLALDILKS